MKRPTNDELLQAIRTASEQTGPITVQLAAIDAYMLTSMLNLATNHPHIGETLRQTGQQIGQRIQRQVIAVTGAPPSYQLSEFADTDLEAGQLLREKFSAAPDIQATVTFHNIFVIVTLLQLTTRHRDLPEQIAAGAVAIGRQFQGLISQISPELNHLLELGWQPEFDVDEDGNPINDTKGDTL